VPSGQQVEGLLTEIDGQHSTILSRECSPLRLVHRHRMLGTTDAGFQHVPHIRIERASSMKDQHIELV
jgi:hypothetical protein